MNEILKALAELEDASERADAAYSMTRDMDLMDLADDLYSQNEMEKKAYLAGAASMRPAVEAVKVLVEAMEKIGYTQDVSPADPETGGPCRIAVANSRNRRILEAQEALRAAARILSEGNNAKG